MFRFFSLLVHAQSRLNRTVKEGARRRLHMTCYDEASKAPISKSAYTILGLRVNADIASQDLLAKKSLQQILPIAAKVEDAVRRSRYRGDPRRQG
jgi:hypothetical protein